MANSRLLAYILAIFSSFFYRTQFLVVISNKESTMTKQCKYYSLYLIVKLYLYRANNGDNDIFISTKLDTYILAYFVFVSPYFVCLQ